MSKKIDESRKKFLISQWFLYLNLSFIFLVFLYGLLPGAFSERKLESEIASYNGEKLSFKAFVCEEADLSYKSRRLTLCAGETGKAGKVLVTTSLYPSYDYGDFLEVSGKLEAPEIFEGFDYPAYLARYDIYSLLYFPQLKLSSGDLSLAQKTKKKLLDFKQDARLILNQNLPEPEAGLASAMLFGYRRSLEKEDLEIFSQVGLRHLMAISGAHLTIISALLLSTLSFLGLSHRRSFFPIIVFLFLFPLITGLAASAIRSALMGFFGFSALYFKRPKSSFRALVFSASLMLIFNPLLLSRDLGFQLSFLAVLGIIYLEPILKRFTNPLIELSFKSLKFKKFLNFVFSLLNLTIASQLASLPIMLFTFEKFSLIAPLANIFLAWTLPFILALLILGIFLSWLLPTLSLYFFWPSYILLNFIFFVSEKLASFQFSALATDSLKEDSFKNLFFIFYYFILVLVVRRFNKKTSPKGKVF